jgi:serine/threonine protein kinase
VYLESLEKGSSDGRVIGGVVSCDNSFTEYVQTRWYRAPETILRPVYAMPVDIWSLGLILAEMICRRPLLPGSSTYNQLIMTIEITNPCVMPGDLDIIPNEKIRMALKDYLVMNGLVGVGGSTPTSGGKRRVSLKRYIWGKYPFIELDYEHSVWNLLEKMVCFDPKLRITASDALKHPFLGSYYRPVDHNFVNLSF